MPTTAQIAQMPLTGGMNEKVDPQLAVTPTLIENLRYVKTGSLGTRPGSSCIGRFNLRDDATVPGTPLLLCTTGTELVRVAADKLDSYRLGTTTDWLAKGRIGAAYVEKKATVGSFNTDIDCACDGTYIAVCYRSVNETLNQDQIVVDILDAITYQTIVARYEVQAPSATAKANPKVIICGFYVFVTWNEGTTIKGINYNTVANVWSAVTTLVTGTVAAGYGYDIVSLSSFAAALATRNTGASNRISVYTMNVITLVVSATYDIGGTDANIGPVAIEASDLDSAIYVAWARWDGANTIDIRAARLNIAGTATSAGPATIFSNTDTAQTAKYLGIVRTSATTRLFAASFSGAENNLTWQEANASFAVQYASGVRCNQDAVALTKPFTFGGRFYVVCAVAKTGKNDTNAVSNTSAIVWDLDGGHYPLAAAETRTGFLAGIFAPFQIMVGTNVAVYGRSVTAAGAVTANGSSVVFAMGTGSYSPLLPAKAQKLTGSVYKISAVSTLGAAASNSLLSVSGGLVTTYDGRLATEAGIVTAPTIFSSAQSAAGGGLTLTATYQWCAVYSYVDAKGNKTYSPVSTILKSTMTSTNDTMTLVLYGIASTNRTLGSSQYTHVELYRTQANGSTFYLDQKAESPNTPASVSVTFTSNSTDTALAANPLLYTTGGILESQAPPGMATVFATTSRLWGISAEDGSAYYSDTLLPLEAPRWHLTRTIPPPSVDNRWTAGAELDEKTILFTADAIWQTYGDGPDATGVGTFAPLQRISSEYGCVTPQSIAKTSEGLWFNSKTGLCLLTRSGEVLNDGFPVEDSSGSTLATPTTMTSAVVVPDLGEVRFSVATTGIQRALVYDTHLGQPGQPVWSRYKWTCPIGGSPTIASACYYGGRYTWITSTGYVFQDDHATYLDTMTGQTSAWVTPIIDFPAFKESTLQGFLRAWRMGVNFDKATACDLTLTVYTDFESSSSQSPTFLASNLDAWSDERAMVRLKRQRVKATRLRVTTGTPTGGPAIGTGQGLTFTSAAIEFQQQGGFRPIPGAQKA